MQCPKCASPTIADLMDGRRGCLDCNFKWQPGGRRGRHANRSSAKNRPVKEEPDGR